MLIDSGANVNLIDESTFDHIIKIRPNIVLKETNIQPKAYGNIPIPLRGEFFATLTNGSKGVAHKILVTTAKQGGNILSKRASLDLGLLSIHQNNRITTSEMPSSTRRILELHLPALNGLGRMRNFQLKLDIDPNVKPVAQSPRRGPFHIRGCR
ncbi:uncharacterized protein LOC121867096 [Homarus americanus]|uniref:uncharacterized protein LOC121867095 n=1 Tax=Homarus americanus TaxID=6706 RepID=UPI001C494D4D|nr:uncharacterized protein LOC121867095 [Homarus americanus]XP_042222786.1 uncharacterized protein LOC121867096 [Homarus americanus]